MRLSAEARRRLVRAGVLLGLALLSAAAALSLRAGRAGWLRGLLAQTDRLLSPRPRAFGGFHLASLGLCLLLAAGAAVLAWRTPPARRAAAADRVVFACGVTFALLELYKQLYCFFIVGNGLYDYSVFPFQFCSLPIYFCLLVPLLPPGRLKSAGLSFLALFGTVGGYLVMGYPNLPERLSLCLHTMLWHSLMIALGAYLLVALRWGAGDWRQGLRREYLPAALLFVCTLGLATLLNVALEPLTANSPGVLNLFYMSPYHPTYFWIISDVQRLLGWPASVLCYVLMFLILGALPLWLAARGLARWRQKHAPEPPA